MDIKPIETYYNGYRFRSRLEARWAVFFDVMGIKYEYEPEGFAMSDGTAYLPDFYLPDAKRWIEIKGKKLSEEELEKCSKFCEAQDSEGVKFTIFIGQPFDGIKALKTSEDGEMMLYTASIKEATIIGIEGYSYQWKTYDLQVKGGEKKHVEDDPAMFWCQGLCEEEVPSRFMPMLWTQTAVSKEHLIESAVLARRARFEHGETPEVKGVTADA